MHAVSENAAAIVAIWTKTVFFDMKHLRKKYPYVKDNKLG
jgi:hypothetical protein